MFSRHICIQFERGSGCEIFYFRWIRFVTIPTWERRYQSLVVHFFVSAVYHLALGFKIANQTKTHEPILLHITEGSNIAFNVSSFFTFSKRVTSIRYCYFSTNMPCRRAISSHSLGRAWIHDIEPKLDQAARYGFDIELFWEDLHYVAQSLPGGPTSENLLDAARRIRFMCDERGISVVCLQPFMHYEGLRDRQKHVRKIEEMKLWTQIAKILQTNIISIPSTCLPEEVASGDFDLIVQDLREVADLVATSGLQIAYEALAWGTYVDKWEQAWDVVERVDRNNLGICLDTFNMAAGVYGDPTTASRKTANAEADMKASFERLVNTVDVRKIMYVQVVDGEYLAEPLVEDHQYYNASQPARMSWSRNCRLFLGEEDRGGYLPVKAILEVILKIGFEGWISAELFNASLTDPDPSVPEQHARRAAESWQKILKEFKINEEPLQHKSETTALRQASEQMPRAQL